MAFSYVVRAQQAVASKDISLAVSSLPFQIACSGGQISLALGLYQQALDFFERARSCLNARQPIRQVGLLYWGLGYCTYALAYQQGSSSSAGYEQMTHFYQRALAYLMQSHTIAQMSGDIQETQSRRLTLAMAQLDWGVWCRQHFTQKATEEQPTKKEIWQAGIFSLFDEASEQCRQALAGFHEKGGSAEQTQSTFLALALLIRVEVQRALLAYEQGYESTFQRERSFASALCQQALDACKEETLLESIVWDVGHLAEGFAASAFSPLPRLPKDSLLREKEKTGSACLGQAELYFAAGEVAEMLGRTATTADFSKSCYANADACFSQALEGLRSSHANYQYDPGYLTRAYQRYLALMEERLREANDHEPETYHVAVSLLALWKQSLLVPPVHPYPL
jgi:tetratricopeptide (TPR) repeat protein